jgi:hypothetical protein
MLSVVHDLVGLAPWDERFFHGGRKVSLATAERTREWVRTFVKRLRRESEIRFILVWHVVGDSRVQLAHSRHMEWEEMEEGLYAIAKELVEDRFCPRKA